jgi:hypothetical protein
MARVESLIKLNGTIGDLSFYKSKSVGYQARMKTGVSGDRIANDPAFARTRENGSEFGRAQQEGKSYAICCAMCCLKMRTTNLAPGWRAGC